MSSAGAIRTLLRERISQRSNDNHRAGRLLPFSGPVNSLLLRHQIAGLATITPASGFVGPIGGIGIGLADGFICYYAVSLVKEVWRLDDSLDVFAVHGVGGILGTLLVAVFASEGLGGAGLGQGVTMSGQFATQVTAVLATVA